jgi:hypothetical protein
LVLGSRSLGVARFAAYALESCVRGEKREGIDARRYVSGPRVERVPPALVSRE